MIGLPGSRKMLTLNQISERKPLWQAFSDLWLDNELQNFEIDHIVSLMKQSGFNFDELERIFYCEVAPTVYKNTLSTTGEWAGFDSDWLFNSILENIKKQESNFVHRLWVNSSVGKYIMTKMVEDDWNKIIENYRSNHQI
jgi:hypothetical protein